MSKYLWYLFYFIITVKGENGTCFDTVTDIATGKTVKNVTEYCAEIPCVFRYCDNVNDIMLREKQGNKLNWTCQSFDEIQRKNNLTIQLKDFNQVYKKDGKDLVRSSKSFWKDYKHLKYSNYTNSNCTLGYFFVNSNASTTIRLLEDGSVSMHLVAQKLDTQRESRSFLVEYQMRTKDVKRQAPVLAIKEFIFAQNENKKEVTFTIYYQSIGLLVSCFFLTLLLVIYGIFRQLRTLAGLILMAHVLTIDVGFLLKATINLALQSRNTPDNFCLYISPIMHFSLLSSFFWMNVMSFDIWWTFRGSIKRRDINRRGIIHKFCMYSLWAFGGPLAIVIMSVVFDHVDPTNTMDIVKPGFASCMHDSPLFYLYTPFTVMIVVNVIFFVLTSINIWRIKRFINNSLKNNPNTKKNENRFILYIKLFLITGINWIIDFIVFIIKPDPWVEYIPDTYNMLIGVVIFGMYICKRKILLLICNRFSICARFVPMLQPRSSQKTTTTKCSDSQS